MRRALGDRSRDDEGFRALNVIIGGANASMATAVIGPTLGMVCRRAVVDGAGHHGTK